MKEPLHKTADSSSVETENIKTTPVARKMMLEEGFSVEDIISGLRKITSSDIQAVKEAGQITKEPGNSAGTASAGTSSSEAASSGSNPKRKFQQARSLQGAPAEQDESAQKKDQREAGGREK